MIWTPGGRPYLVKFWLKVAPASASMRDTWLNCLKYDSLQFLENQTGGQLEKIQQEQLNKQAIEVTSR